MDIPKISNEDILHSYAADYLSDQHFTRSWSFGVQIDDEKWHIEMMKAEKGEKSSFKVERGFPSEPSIYFVTTFNTLRDIYQGKINALTGSVKAFSTDYAPFDLEVMEGYQPDENFVGEVIPFIFHFWTKGTPEIIPFGPKKTRTTHGAQASIFYYQPGLRSGWGTIYPGQHANEHPSSKKNDFPSLVIMTKGKVIARIDGVDHELSEYNAIFIPPGVSHEFINRFDEPAEFILLMFGEGA